MNGLLLDDESVYRAMDTKGTGEFVPLSFSTKTGKVLNSKKARWPMRRSWAASGIIWTACSSIWRKTLYSGRIDAEPLCPGGGKKPLYLL